MGDGSVGRRSRRWLLVVAAAAYLVVVYSTFEIDHQRLLEGADRGRLFVMGFFPPDFHTRSSDIFAGLLESLAMTVVATVLGVMLSVPVALGASANLSPKPIYLCCRGIIILSRSFHEVLIAILFVVVVGFGPLAGVLTLSIATVGFFAKMLAEAVEEVDETTLDAIRATGAPPFSLLSWGVAPQVLPRFVGLSIYRLDINFRESAIVGIVGAGGIGATLNTAFGRYEYDTAAAILLLIMGIVLVGELGSGIVRRRLV